MFPLWFLTWRKGGRVACSVVNGESGKVVSDLPIDMKTFSPGTAYYAEQCAIRYFEDDPAVLFLIDTDEREIYVYANGTAQKTISKADARAITDNIYLSASRGDYYECADGAFRQIYAKCTGQKLARPMKDE